MDIIHAIAGRLGYPAKILTPQGRFRDSRLGRRDEPLSGQEYRRRIGQGHADSGISNQVAA